jgi:hypothetical protein
MKKSRNESISSTPQYMPPKEGNWLIESFISEGGFSLLILFPTVVLYFLARAANLL